VPALPSGELGGCLGRRAKVGAKNAIVWFGTNVHQKKDERTPKKRNEHHESE